MWKNVVGGILGVLALVVVALLALVATRPSHTHIERSVVIEATPADVWPHVSDLRAFMAWNPWAAEDPTQTVEYGATTAGPGGTYKWFGGQTGSGSMTIVDMKPMDSVHVRMDFTEPMTSTADANFLLSPVDASHTKFTWTFDGENGFFGKAAGLVMDMDSMIGGTFERGLAMLAVSAQDTARAREAAAAIEAEKASVPPMIDGAVAPLAPLVAPEGASMGPGAK